MSIEHQRFYTFYVGDHKFSILHGTLARFLNQGGHLRVVDLSLPERELPDLSGKSRKEIIEILANNVGGDHAKLVDALKRNNIEHTVTGLTKNIFVKNCDWKILSKISKLVDQLQCDLTISGGGPWKYLMQAPFQDVDRRAVTNTMTYQQRIARSRFQRVPGVAIGVIDSGCSDSLYTELTARERVIMHHKMIETVDAENPVEVDYEDCFEQIIDGIRYTGHGTGVVEILSNCVSASTLICVANVGNEFDGDNVDCAISELFDLGVSVVNCSFTVESNSM